MVLSSFQKNFYVEPAAVRNRSMVDNFKKIKIDYLI